MVPLVSLISVTHKRFEEQCRYFLLKQAVVLLNGKEGSTGNYSAQFTSSYNALVILPDLSST
jgi:hypothetical protein